MKAVAIGLLKKLLFDDVLDCTIGVMFNLHAALTEIKTCDGELAELLLQLYSETIRGALHKSEIPVTNRVITAKNALLKRSGIAIPEGHELIDPDKYKGVNW